MSVNDSTPQTVEKTTPSISTNILPMIVSVPAGVTYHALKVRIMGGEWVDVPATFHTLPDGRVEVRRNE